MGEQIKIVLIPSDDDPGVLEPTYQEEVVGFGRKLGELGTIVSQRFYFQDDSTAIVRQLGEYAVEIAPVAVPAVSGLIGAWLQARFGRKVRIKVGDVEVEASTAREVDQLLQKAKAFRADDIPKP